MPANEYWLWLHDWVNFRTRLIQRDFFLIPLVEAKHKWELRLEEFKFDVSNDEWVGKLYVERGIDPLDLIIKIHSQINQSNNYSRTMK